MPSQRYPMHHSSVLQHRHFESLWRALLKLSSLLLFNCWVMKRPKSLQLFQDLLLTRQNQIQLEPHLMSRLKHYFHYYLKQELKSFHFFFQFPQLHPWCCILWLFQDDQSNTKHWDSVCFGQQQLHFQEPI